MAQNLNYAYTGVPFYYEDDNITSDSTSWCYDNDPANCTKYGRLYTWAAAMDSVGTWSTNGKGCGDGKTCMPTYPVRGICPEGWHLPDTTEWAALLTAVDGKSTAGDMLKSTSGWNSSGNGSDAYSFAALPAGVRYFDGFDSEGAAAGFWSSTEYNGIDAHYMYLYYNHGIAHLNENSKIYGLSVRCVKDDSGAGVTPQSNSSETSASSSSLVSETVDPSTVVKGTMTDERDGQTYKTVTIGSQTWMAENLNYAYLQPTAESDSSSFCYKDSVSYCEKYGRLYLWSAAMDSAGIWSTNGKGCGDNKTCLPTYPVRGVCPEGWHLPTQAEWKTLFAMVGGQSTAAKMLKSASGWNDYDGASGNGTDAYGFSALPAGIRGCCGEDYISGGKYANFWSSAEYSSNRAYDMFLSYHDGYACLNFNPKYAGFPVRCLKD